jgi:hypothetical protein
MVMSTQEPTIMRWNIGGRSMSMALACGTSTAAAGAGSAPTLCATSFSIFVIKASASAVRPCASSQRGDSGRFLRRYQTMSEPMPAMTNMGRQPQVGIVR